MAQDLIKKKFGKHLRELRLSRGISSQVALSAKAGLDRSYVGGVERGQRNISLVNLDKIARALGLTLEELFRFTPSSTYVSGEKKMWLLHDKK